MNSKESLDRWEQRKTQYANQWEIGVMNAPCKDPAYCCFAMLCPCCVSYILRKQALHGDLSDYTCCNGMLMCSGYCGERSCPELCLACEVFCCFGTSVAVTRWTIQDELRIQNSKCDNCILGTMLFFQQLACICQLAACLTGNDAIERIADLISCIADILWCTVCGCLQTQHKIQLDSRDMNAIQNVPPPQQQIPYPQDQGMYERQTGYPQVQAPAGYPLQSHQIYH